MNIFSKNFLVKIQTKDYISLFLIHIYPIAIISGNLIINFTIIMFALSFCLNFKENKKFIENIENKVIYLFLIFFISLIINSIFSINFSNSIQRVIKVFFVFFLIMEVTRILKKYDYRIINILLQFWSIVFIIITLDFIFEFIMGYNLIGIKSYYHGRLAGFFGDELVGGAFYHGFSLLVLTYMIYNFKNKNYFFLSIITVFCVSFIIGERANFIKIFFSITLFLMFIKEISLKKKILIFLISILFIISSLNLNKDYKLRYYVQLQSLLSKGGISNYLKNSQYGAHQLTALKIFYEYPVFGVGIKNFRHESKKEKYEDKNNPTTKLRYATHPHQIHLEFLSETGMVGFLIYIIFICYSCFLGIKEYVNKNNYLLLSSIIYIISINLPIIPSGSFLSTYVSGIFWINYAIMAAFIIKEKPKL